MYYGIIIIAVVMFGTCFAIQDTYRKVRGASGLKMSFETTLVGSLAGIIVLAIANCVSFSDGISFNISGLNPGFTPFTLIMAFLAATNSLAFTYCSFKALGCINLSMFSLFSMLGGMLLPFLQGIIFYDESVTLAKIICVVFICAALAFTLDFRGDGEKKKGYIYYAGIFVFNGMSGVLSKVFSSSTLPKTTDAGYSLWLAFISAVISAVILFTVFRKKEESEPPYTAKAAALSCTSGSLSKIANFLLVLALSGGVDASAQYPLVTGGVMILSTSIAFLGDRKPSKNELISVALAFVGTLALFIIPEVIIF